MTTLLTNKIVVCRKPHRCDWCGEQISKGVKANYQTGVFDGDFYSSYMHSECHSAALESWDDLRSDGYEPYQQQRGKTYEDSHA